jgi:hypothetical protein
MAASNITVLSSDLVDRSKTWQEAVEKGAHIMIHQKYGLYSSAEFIMSSILYLSICLLEMKLIRSSE